MSKHDHETSSLQQPESEFDQYVVSKFLKIRPEVFGGLEIVLGVAVFALTIWKGIYYILCTSIISVLIGPLTVLAAHKRTIRWVRASQFLNYLNAITSIISIPFHGFANDGVTHIVLMVCDAVVFLFSIILASTSCEGCSATRRPVHSTGVYHTNSPLPGVTIVCDSTELYCTNSFQFSSIRAAIRIQTNLFQTT